MATFLFPGQGSQKPGMGAAFLAASSAAAEVLEQAAASYSDSPGLLSLITDAGEEILNLTRNAQPALMALAYAITRHLEYLGIRPDLCAGHSLGEIPALVAVGALTFPDAMRLVRERARLMSGETPEGGMAAVMGLEPEAIAEALPDDVQVANYNGPGQTIISGATPGLERAAATLKAAGAKRVLPLRVSGPFHSLLMRPAAEKLALFLESVPLASPGVLFVSSVSAQLESDPSVIRRLLSEQLYQPVRWTDVMVRVGQGTAIEVGPGTVLKGLARRMEGAPEIHSAESPESCAKIPKE